MTNEEAWRRISAMCLELYHYREDHGKQPYTQEDIDMELAIFNAMAKRKKDNDRGVHR